jgi:hypothetical protein
VAKCNALQADGWADSPGADVLLVLLICSAAQLEAVQAAGCAAHRAKSFAHTAVECSRGQNAVIGKVLLLQLLLIFVELLAAPRDVGSMLCGFM